MNPTILLDVDGVLADFQSHYLGAIYAETGMVCDAASIDRWDIHETDVFIAAAKHIGIELSALRKRVDAHVVKPDFCATIAVQQGAVEAVTRLQELGDVFVVTSPWDSSPTWMHERHHWVHRHFGIPRHHVIHTGRKHLIRGDIFVDDKLSHVEEWSAAWPNGLPILFDMPHNRGTDAVGVARAGWPFIIGVAEDMARDGFVEAERSRSFRRVRT
jgi:5'(3')-deoxyribonucleotidase